MMEEHSTTELIYNLRERIARLEERLLSSDKALDIARIAVESNKKNQDSGWDHIVSIIAIVISILVLVTQFFKR